MFLNFKKGINTVLVNLIYYIHSYGELQSYIVVTSQNMNKKLGAPTPLALFTNK
jgi:hypothetical protein